MLISTAVAIVFCAAGLATDCPGGDALALLQLRSGSSESGRLDKEGCPARCVSCKLGPLQKKMHGKCTLFCSRFGWCGSSDKHRVGGTDCTSCAKSATDILQPIGKQGQFCHFDGSLPWWLVAGKSTNVGIECSGQSSICEKLKRTAELACGGTVEAAECTALTATTKKVPKGLITGMSDADEAQNPCAPMMSKLGADFKNVCWANDHGCGAVVKTTGATCEATCAKAGLSCVSGYGSNTGPGQSQQEQGEGCGNWWAADRQSCNQRMGGHSLCECSAAPAEEACEDFEGFTFAEGFQHCQAVNWRGHKYAGQKIPDTMLRLGNCKEAEWTALVPAGTLTFTSRPDEHHKRAQADSMTVLINGEVVETHKNDKQDEVSVDVPETSTVRVKAKSANKDTYLHMSFTGLKSCATPITKKITSEGFYLDGHYFLCEDFETTSVSISVPTPAPTTEKPTPETAPEPAPPQQEEEEIPDNRCGPLFQDKVCNCAGDFPKALYCNEKNGWCGDTPAHRNAQSSTTYDCVKKPAYTMIESTGDQMADACEAKGMAVIVTTPACDAAAEALGLSDTTSQNGIDSPRWRPYGCVWNRGRLQLNLNSGARQRGTASDNTVKQICES